MELAQIIKIEKVEHEWLSSVECDFNNCIKNTAEITWCDDCDIAFCKQHIDYTNDYDKGITLCPECNERRIKRETK